MFYKNCLTDNSLEKIIFIIKFVSDQFKANEMLASHYGLVLHLIKSKLWSNVESLFIYLYLSIL